MTKRPIGDFEKLAYMMAVVPKEELIEVLMDLYCFTYEHDEKFRKKFDRDYERNRFDWHYQRAKRLR